MKTKIKTILTICALGFIGIININATVDYKKAANTEVVENLKNGSNTTDIGLTTSIEKTTSSESDAKFETFESVQFLLNEDLDAKVDLQKEAQSVTRWIVDQEEARVFQKLIAEGEFDKFEAVQFPLNENLDAKTDLQREALLVTKWIVDLQEAKVINKLIAEGKLGEIN